jgi:hypothetical protein
MQNVQARKVASNSQKIAAHLPSGCSATYDAYQGFLAIFPLLRAVPPAKADAVQSEHGRERSIHDKHAPLMDAFHLFTEQGDTTSALFPSGGRNLTTRPPFSSSPYSGKRKRPIQSLSWALGNLLLCPSYQYVNQNGSPMITMEGAITVLVTVLSLSERQSLLIVAIA